MDASQHKDYVLVLLLVKHSSDNDADQPYAPINIPAGASFADMVALKGTTDIGDQIKKKILGALAKAKLEVFDYIEVFYNRVRRHKHLDQLSHHEFERQRQTAL